MRFFNKIFNKEKHLTSDKDFDEKYKIVLIKGFNDNTPYICEIDDDRYTSVLFDFPKDYSAKDLKIYKFNRDDFINYLKRAGCSDIVVDGFIDCTSSDINKDKMPKTKYLKVYDYDGKFIGTKRK